MAYNNELNFVVTYVKLNASDFKYINKKILTDDEYYKLCIEAVKLNNNVIMYIDNPTDELYSLVYIDLLPYHIQLQYLANNGLLLKYITSQTDDHCYTAIRNNPCSIEFVKDQSIGICHEVIMRDSSCFKYIKDKNDYLCSKVIQHYRYGEYDIDIDYETIINNPYLINLFHEFDTLKSFIKLDPWIIEFIQDQTHQLCNYLVRCDPKYFKLCKMQNFQICLIAIYNNVDNLKYVNNQCDILCWEALKYSAQAIRSIKNPHHDMWLYALNRDPDLIKYCNEKLDYDMYLKIFRNNLLNANHIPSDILYEIIQNNKLEYNILINSDVIHNLIQKDVLVFKNNLIADEYINKVDKYMIKHIIHHTPYLIKIIWDKTDIMTLNAIRADPRLMVYCIEGYDYQFYESVLDNIIDIKSIIDYIPPITIIKYIFEHKISYMHLSENIFNILHKYHPYFMETCVIKSLNKYYHYHVPLFAIKALLSDNYLQLIETNTFDVNCIPDEIFKNLVKN